MGVNLKEILYMFHIARSPRGPLVDFMFNEDSVEPFFELQHLFPSNEVTTKVRRSKRSKFEKEYFQASVRGDFMSNGQGVLWMSRAS